MIASKTDIKGCYVLTYTKSEDNRGDFSRLVCKKNLAAINIDFDLKQSSIAFNKKKDTARGLHYQEEPYSESKIITCVSGSIDVFVIDIKTDVMIAKKLDSRSKFRELVYVPKHCASGYITLENNSCVLYYMDEYYHPESAKVISLEIEGNNNVIMSDKDMAVSK